MTLDEFLDELRESGIPVAHEQANGTSFMVNAPAKRGWVERLLALPIKGEPVQEWHIRWSEPVRVEWKKPWKSA